MPVHTAWKLRAPFAALLVAAASGALASPFAYVSNEGSGTISIIDVADDQVVAEIAGAGKPRGMAVSPDGRTVYVSDQAGDRLIVFDAATKRATGSVALGRSPEGVGMSADGRWVAIAVEESNEVAFVDARTATLAFSVRVSGRNPEHAVFAPDGRRVFVSAEDGRSVDVIDVAARRVVAEIAVGMRPRGIGFSPDGTRAWVAAELANEVYVIDAVLLKVVKVIPVGLRSNGIAVHPGCDSRLRLERRRRHDLGDRHGDARRRRDDPGRPATVEHGADAGRRQALCRLRSLGDGVGDRHAAAGTNRRRRGRQASVGRVDSLNAKPGDGSRRRGVRVAPTACIRATR